MSNVLAALRALFAKAPASVPARRGAVAIYRRRGELIVVPQRRGIQEVDPAVRVEPTVPALLEAVRAALAVSATCSFALEPATGPPPSYRAVGARRDREFLSDTSHADLHEAADGSWVVGAWLPARGGFGAMERHTFPALDAAVAAAFRHVTEGPAHSR